jgi:hypothetical protein
MQTYGAYSIAGAVLRLLQTDFSGTPHKHVAEVQPCAAQAPLCHAPQAQNMAAEGTDGAAPNLNTSAHDNVAAATASGVDSAIAGAQAQGECRCQFWHMASALHDF